MNDIEIISDQELRELREICSGERARLTGVTSLSSRQAARLVTALQQAIGRLAAVERELARLRESRAGLREIMMAELQDVRQKLAAAEKAACPHGCAQGPGVCGLCDDAVANALGVFPGDETAASAARRIVGERDAASARGDELEKALRSHIECYGGASHHAEDCPEPEKCREHAVDTICEHALARD